MVDKARRWLIESLQKRLIPAFEECGFQVIPLAGEKAESHELRAAFPFGRLRRETAQGIEMVEVQLDKHGNAAFRLNVGVGPTEGIQNQIGYVAPEDMWIHYLNRYYEAYDCPLLQCWFRVRRWFGPSATLMDYDNLVTTNLGLIREVEDLWRNGKQGRHMRMVER